MIGCIVITVTRSVPLVGAAFGDHLNQCATGSVKVIRLAESADFEFLHRVNRSRDYTRGHRTGLGSRETGKVLDISDRITGHVIRVVAAINRESVLVHVAAGNIPSRGHARVES